MRRRCVLSVILLCNVVTSKPATGETYTDPVTGRKCCPCPDEQLGSSSDQRAADTAPVGIRWPGQSRADDCTGEHSIFSPNVMRGARPPGSSEDGKEIQPLLRPEVDFASSMVDTLREATDEEYREALLRDAARSSSRALQPGLWSPKDVASEESNPSSLLSELLSIPNSFQELFAADSNVAASGDNEQRVAGTSTKPRDSLKANLDPLNIFSEGGCLKSPKFDLKNPGEVNLFRNNDGAGILKSKFDKNIGSKSFLHNLPKIGDLIKTNDKKPIPARENNLRNKGYDTDSEYSPSKVDERLSHPEVMPGSTKKIPQMLLPSINRDAESDMFKNLFKGMGTFSLSDLLHPLKKIAEEKNLENQNPSINNKKMKTEIIEIADSDADFEMGATGGNKFAEAKGNQFSLLNINKLPLENHNTKIITHIPTSNVEESGDFESTESMNEVENDINDFGRNQDTLPNASNDIPKYVLFSPNPGDTAGTNMGQMFEQIMSPQLRSNMGNNEISKNLLKLRKQISEGIEKFKTPEFRKLSSTDSKSSLNQLVSTDRLQETPKKQKYRKSSMVSLAQPKNDAGPNKKSMDEVARNAGDKVTNKINDMTSEASERISNIFNNLQSPQIVQPASLFDELENPFDTFNTRDFSNIFHVPSLANDDLLSRIDEWLSSSDVTPDFKSALSTYLKNNNLLRSTVVESNPGLPRTVGVLPSMSNGIMASNLFQNTNNLHDIHDLPESLLENAQNLLRNPILANNGNVLQDTLKSGQDLTDSLKDQAKNAVNNLQNNLSKSMKEVGLVGRGTPDFDNPLPFNTDVIEDLIARHENLEGKLKGIHYDLSDRLETLRNNILDHLPDPLMIGESSDIKVVREPFSFSDMKARNQKTADKLGSPLENGNLLNLLSPNFNDNLKSSWNSLNRSPGASSSLLFPSNSRAAPLLTNTRTPKNQPKSKTAPVLRYRNKPLISKSQSKLKNSLSESLLQKSNEPLLKIFGEGSPFSSWRNTPNSVSKSSNTLKSGPSRAQSMKSSTLRTQPDRLLTSQPRLQSKNELTSPSRPKIIDRAVLTKIRDSINDRLSSFGRNDIGDDMFKSASSNMNNEIDSDSMKEQVPYTCNMVCKKV